MRPRLKILIVFLSSLLFCETAVSQQTNMLAPRDPINPRVAQELNRIPAGMTRSMVGGLWTIDGNRKATISITNGLDVSALTVTPTLYLSNGAKYELAPVTLEVSGTATVDINAALTAKGVSGLAPLSGYVEVAYVWAWDPLCVTVTSVDPVHSVVFSSSLQPSQASAGSVIAVPQKDGRNDIEGMWWKPEAGTTAFVSLSNPTSVAISAEIDTSDAQDQTIDSATITVSPHGTKTVPLSVVEKALPGSTGGLRVFYKGPIDGLLLNAGLQNLSSGYSANLPFHYSLDSPAKSESRTELYSQPGLLIGAADPMMHFPAGTTFKPFSVVRNVSGSPISVTPTLYWMAGGNAHSWSQASVNVQPAETLDLGVPGMLAAAGLSATGGSVTLTLSVQGPAHSLLVAGGSVDLKGTYVFQVVPRMVNKSLAKSISYWSTGKGNDTMVTVWNPADEAQDYLFTVLFTGGRYRLPIHLEAHATRSFQMSELIQTQLADDEGNTIPLSVHEGSARLTGVHAENESILASIDSGVYNTHNATCAYYCVSCDGARIAQLLQLPYILAKGNSASLTLSTQDNHGNSYTTGASSWSSSNTSVVTATGQTYSSQIVTKGVSNGSATVSVSTTNNLALYNASYCAYNAECPNIGQLAASAPAPVTTVSITGVSPTPLIIGTTGILAVTGSGFNSIANYSPTIVFDQSGIQAGKVTIQSDSVMTASYSVNCGTPLGLQNLLVLFNSDGPQYSNRYPITIGLPSAPTPVISFDGNDISGTQSAVAGQQINMGATVSLPTCMAMSSQKWTPPTGTAVGGYAASANSGQVQPLPDNTASYYTFYWVYPKNGLTTSYTYTMSANGGSVTSSPITATFNVAGPTGGSMVSTAYNSVSIANLTACPTIPNSAGPYLIYAGGPFSGTSCGGGAIVGTRGITFNAPSGYSNSSNGSFFLTQLIAYDTLTGTGTATIPGLDQPTPYGGGGPFPHSDSPKLQLSPSYTCISRDFEAQVFVMWQSNTINSIPVPLGYQYWGFNGVADRSGPFHSWRATTVSAGLQGSYTNITSGSSPDYGYPTWTQAAQQVSQ